MTKEEQIKIEGKALLEELKFYEYMNHTYLTELENSLKAFDLDKIAFCLKNILAIFRERDERYVRNTDYKNLAEFYGTVQELISDKEKKTRESIPLMRFFTALKVWLDSEVQGTAEIFNSKYIESYYNFNQCYYTLVLDLNTLYKLVYGKNYIEIDEQNICYQTIMEFIEAYYLEVIEPKEGRLKFTIKVNELLNRFELPFQLKRGKFLKIGYMTSYPIERIENYEQFERKVGYASKMIVHGDFIDKHCALKYIADAFCYFCSIYKNDTDKSLGALVNSDNNSNVYKIVKDEVTFIKRVINDTFDIRHNEKNSNTLNGQKQKRETLDDPIFTEYLYNRINAILMLLRIKRSQQNKTLQVDE